MSNRKIWVCKDGRKMRIKDMEDQHLINTIKMLERKHKLNLAEIPYPCFQGEMAQYYAELDYEAIQNSEAADQYPILLDMYAEADKRKLRVEVS